MRLSAELLLSLIDRFALIFAIRRRVERRRVALPAEFMRSTRMKAAWLERYR